MTKSLPSASRAAGNAAIISRDSRATQTHARRAAALLVTVSVTACSDAQVAQQVLRGTILQNQFPARVEDVRAVRSDGRLIALDQIDLDGRFILVLPPGESYVLEMRAADGAKIAAFDGIFIRVCAVEALVDLGTIAPSNPCAPGRECEKARAALEACKVDHEQTCASMARSINDCRSHRDVACESERASAEACFESLCADRACPEQEAACAGQAKRYDDCSGAFGCASLESSYIETCVETCQGALAEVDVACSPPDMPDEPAPCEHDSDRIPPLEIDIGCRGEFAPPKEVGP